MELKWEENGKVCKTNMEMKLGKNIPIDTSAVVQKIRGLKDVGTYIFSFKTFASWAIK